MMRKFLYTKIPTSAIGCTKNKIVKQQEFALPGRLTLDNSKLSGQQSVVISKSAVLKE